MRSMFRILIMSLAVLTSAVANAALIEGTMTLSGDYTATMSDINDLTTVADVTLGTVTTAGTATLDYGTTIGFGTSDGSGSGTVDLGAFVPVSNFFTYGGWQLDLTSLTVEADSTAMFLHLHGNGMVSGNTVSGIGYQDTPATWSFSASDNTSFSMSVTSVAVVPVPAAVWLFGSGLIGLVGVARRKS